MAEPRRGWPLDHIPAGQEHWVAFVRQATPEEIERMCLTLAADVIREGRDDPLADAIAAFLLGREAAGCTPATLKSYAWALAHFRRAVGLPAPEAITPEVVEAYLTGLRARVKPVSVHRHYRVLRTFTRWLARTGRLPADPMVDITMRVPKTLPTVPTDEAVRKLLDACPDTFEGRRNRCMIALLADSGMRKEEARRLRVGDMDPATRTIRVRVGKGQRDGVGYFGDATASLLRTWLRIHPNPTPAAPLFCTKAGDPLGVYAITRILHRLSRRAGLEKKIGAHALRHFAATSILRRTGDLELVRRVLRHSTLTMALRYATLADTEIAAKFVHASPMDHLRMPAPR
jgi:site-specific recombinase XerD